MVILWFSSEPTSYPISRHNLPTRHVPPALCCQNLNRTDVMNVFCSSGCSLPFSQKKKKKNRQFGRRLTRASRKVRFFLELLKNPSVDLVRVAYGSNSDCAVGRASSPLAGQICNWLHITTPIFLLSHGVNQDATHPVYLSGSPFH